MDKQIIILKVLKQSLVDTFGENIKQVILFGSQTINKANENSDYDILIVLKNEYDWIYKDKVYTECYNVELKEDVFFDINIISENELNNTLRGKQSFILNAINKGVIA
jgi:predicted nucleotidyltransferase